MELIVSYSRKWLRLKINKEDMSKMYLDPRTKDKFITKDEYFKIMFGEEFLDSNVKGTIQEYEDSKL